VRGWLVPARTLPDGNTENETDEVYFAESVQSERRGSNPLVG
jgi:hypothetical protein